MSRIGNQPISIPTGVSVSIAGNVVNVKGPKGELQQTIDRDIAIEIENDAIEVKRPTDQKRHKAMHGLYRSLVNNMVKGVSEGYTIKLELVGVGYKASVQNNVLELSLGYSHGIFLVLPEGIKAQAETVRGQNPTIILEGYDKQLIGQVAAKIKSLRPVEPYKGKGVRFAGEKIRRKAGKATAK